MNLIFQLSTLDLNDLLYIWRMVSKFKNRPMRLWIFLSDSATQHYLTSLIYKLDWMVKSQGYDIKFEIMFKAQYEKAGIMKYLKERGIDYAISLSRNVFFTNKSPVKLLELIDNKQPFKVGSYLIGHDIINCSNPVELDQDEYQLIIDAQKANKDNPIIWIFVDPETNKFRDQWSEEIKQKYLNGEELFYEYQTNTGL